MVLGDPEINVILQEPEAPKPVLPTSLALPWSSISRRLGVPPILIHATISLSNWRKLDPEGPFSLPNLTTIYSLDSTRWLILETEDDQPNQTTSGTWQFSSSFHFLLREPPFQL